MEIQKNRTSIWIIDDNISFCVILAEVLNRTENFECKKYYHSVKLALRALKETETPPKIILLDIQMPDISGLDAITPIKKFDPSILIVMLTSFDEENDIKSALQRGADGYLSKSSNPMDILRSIERLLEGGKIIDPHIAEKMINNILGGTGKFDYHLSKREKEIIKLLVEGSSISKIADILKISFYTAETHRKNIFQKLDVHTSHGLVAKALKEGLVD